MNRSLVIALLAPALLGTTASAEAPAGEPTTQPEVRSVSADFEPLKRWFNENRGKPRLIVLLSPT